MYTNAHAQVQGVVSKWIGVEHAVESALPFAHIIEILTIYFW